MHRNVFGLENSNKRAAELYKEAASQGHGKSIYDLGRLYEKGRGFKKDMKEAIRLYRLTARQRWPRALYTYGFLYHRGKGVPKGLKGAAEFVAQ